MLDTITSSVVQWDILIVSNNLCFIEGLKRILETIDSLRFLHPLNEPEQTFLLLEHIRPDFLLVQHPQQDRFLYQLKQRYPRICSITLDQKSPYGDYCISSGISFRQQLQELLQQQLQARLQFPIKGVPLYHNLIQKVQFTQQELNILALLTYGYNYEEIADKLNLSRNTIKKYVNLLRDKVNAKDKAHLICIALRSGLIA
ncbi:response regulator transcription factor [Chroococcus sp. FPU101]|uniref:response regulator transcription factor n=1 Tax=Chroococcus sp. FPU101 TaxID=1974212 RepID=UPI001A8C9078|nr:LuxR C-terminal-related transcriptional regulator [Chroococcus sp. FPU101]GFE72031.1 transcriptional regulator, LuxR family [Chroococcus sp. FPU101]